MKDIRDDELLIVREFDAPVALVFRLWEDRHHMLRWWGPEEFTTVELDWDARQKSRFSATDSQGRALAVFLPRGTAVRGGDVLVAEDGSLVRVLAAPQTVLRITPCAQHGSPFDLTRAAYHLGNRHVPIELTPEYLQIEPDHVLADMLRAMHLTVTEVQAPFEPEGGAYGGHVTHDGHSHHHHGQGHHHDHAHGGHHDHGHGHEH